MSIHTNIIGVRCFTITIKKQEPIFNIVELQTDLLIGRCAFFAIDKVDRRAMFGIAIGEKAYWDKGYGQEATKLLLDYGFNLLNLNSVMLGVFSYDIVLMDILAEEFESVYVKKFIRKETG
jgi:RimJ/RimL family protein N-acetyltransferase